MHTLQILVNEEQYTLLDFPGRPKALLDRSVAKIFEVETRYINRTVTRNPERFPSDFCFELNDQEIEFLKSQFGISNSRMFNRAKPKAFSAYGCNMVAMLLHSDIAIKHSVQIIRAFTMFEREIQQQRNIPQTTYEEIISDLPKIISGEVVGDRQLIKAIVNEIDFIKNGIYSMQTRLNNLEDLLRDQKVCEVQITSKQLQQLKEIVKIKSFDRKQTHKLWSQFKKYFSIKKYALLPCHKFNEAVKWLKEYPQ